MFSILFICLLSFHDVTGYRWRIDLKVPNPALLKEKAEAMSKPFPHRGKRLSWEELKEVAGRTQEELDQIISDLKKDGCSNIKQCLSNQCISFDTDGSFKENYEKSSYHDITFQLENLEQVRTRRSLKYHTYNHSNERHLNEHSDLKEKIEFKHGSLEVLMNNHNAQHGRRVQESNKESDFYAFMNKELNHDLFYSNVGKQDSHVQPVAVPVLCGSDDAGTSYSVENQNNDPCPLSQNITITLTATPWYAEDLTAGPIKSFTVLPHDLKKTRPCSYYSEKMICESHFNDQLKITLKYTDDTVMRILHVGDVLPHGVAYFDIKLKYTLDGHSFSFKSDDSTVLFTPKIKYDYGRAKYNVPKGHKGKGLGMTALPLGFENSFSEDGLKAYLEASDLPVPDVNIIKSSIFEGIDIADCASDCSESNLDVQMITSYGTGANFDFLAGDQFATAKDVNPSFVAYREALIENDTYPDVLSLSYGNSATHYSDDLDNTLMGFISVGITVLASSGDNGAVGYVTGDECTPKVNQLDYFQLPAASPWILSVGATMEVNPTQSNQAGLAASMFQAGGMVTSGGMITEANSSNLELPEYQKKAVEGYLKSQSFKAWPFLPKEISSPGRAYPDVSAFGTNVPIILQDSEGLFNSNVGGTSAASPAFSGLLLQVRGALLSATECNGIDVTFGHINPMIYWAAENRPNAFIDVTVGNNVYDKKGNYCGQGFVTAEGWDPVTGVGMMNFPAFVEAAKEYYCIGIENISNKGKKGTKTKEGNKSTKGGRRSRFRS